MITKPLYGKNKVNLDERSLHIGGAWTPQGVYDPALIQFMAEKMSKIKNPVLVDVGASTGSFALLPRFLGGEVIAFEPHPEAYEILCINLQLNEMRGRARTFKLALHAYDGSATLKISNKKSQSGLSTLGKPKLFSQYREIRVTCKKLDSMRLGRVDFLKIDTEGCELGVLTGARRLIISNHPRILLEHNARNAAQFGNEPDMTIEYLRQFGYTKFEKKGREDLWIS